MDLLACDNAMSDSGLARLHLSATDLAPLGLAVGAVIVSAIAASRPTRVADQAKLLAIFALLATGLGVFFLDLPMRISPLGVGSAALYVGLVGYLHLRRPAPSRAMPSATPLEAWRERNSRPVESVERRAAAPAFVENEASPAQERVWNARGDGGVSL